MVGDYLYDLQAAEAAGTDSALLWNGEGERPAFASMATYCVRQLREIVSLVNGR